MESVLLLLLLTLPLIGVFFMALAHGDERLVERNVWHIAVLTSGMTFLLAFALFVRFDPAGEAVQFTSSYPLMPMVGNFVLGLDGLSLLFVLLTSFLFFMAVLVSHTQIDKNRRTYLMLFMLIESLVLGAFAVRNLLFFYVFFEGVLPPMFLLIGMWGSVHSLSAAYRFLFFTLAGSVLFFLVLLILLAHTDGNNFENLAQMHYGTGLQRWLFLGIFISFAVKLPLWPLHVWLPQAHVEAPTSASMVLAGILLKLGGYGLIRFMTILPEGVAYYRPIVLTLGFISLIYASAVALVQKDMKRMVAYASVAHMGLVVVGLFSGHEVGFLGAILLMLSHGLVAGAMFFSVGVLYDRLHTRDIRRYGGLFSLMPFFAGCLLLYVLAGIGLPGTSGFAGEVLITTGALRYSLLTGVLAGMGALLSAAYLLWLYRHLAFGTLSKESFPDLIGRLNPREKLIAVSFAFAILLMGFQPLLFSRPLNRSHILPADLRVTVPVMEVKDAS